MIPMVAPPISDPHRHIDDQRSRYREGNTMTQQGESVGRNSAPSGGLRNAYGLVMHEQPTWREGVVGSAFLLTVLAAGTTITGVGLVLRRRRVRSHI